jgi:prepilin-type N-terminal cleavage/methylation domain-containing protein
MKLYRCLTDSRLFPKESYNGAMTRILSKTGFTLIDMMVSVAILAVLMALAYPKIIKFKARSNQLAAKNELASIFAAQKNFREYYKTYSVDWQAAGYQPKGIDISGLYPVTFDRNRAYGYTNGDATAPLPTTMAVLGLPAGSSWPNFYGAHYSRCSIVGNTSATSNPGLEGAETALGAPIAFVSKTTFRANAIGCPVRNLTSHANLDRWSIDHNSVLSQLNDGNP